jgi:hypothetical protein
LGDAATTATEAALSFSLAGATLGSSDVSVGCARTGAGPDPMATGQPDVALGARRRRGHARPVPRREAHVGRLGLPVLPRERHHRATLWSPVEHVVEDGQVDHLPGPGLLQPGAHRLEAIDDQPLRVLLLRPGGDGVDVLAIVQRRALRRVVLALREQLEGRAAPGDAGGATWALTTSGIGSALAPRPTGPLVTGAESTLVTGFTACVEGTGSTLATGAGAAWGGGVAAGAPALAAIFASAAATISRSSAEPDEPNPTVCAAERFFVPASTGAPPEATGAAPEPPGAGPEATGAAPEALVRSPGAAKSGAGPEATGAGPEATGAGPPPVQAPRPPDPSVSGASSGARFTR